MKRRLGDMRRGESFESPFGKFYVLKQVKGGALLMNDDQMIGAIAYAKSGTNGYARSTIRELLNDEIRDAFEAFFGPGNLIAKKKNIRTYPGNRKGGEVRDKVRILTMQETMKYMDIISKEFKEYTCFWTMSPNDGSAIYAAAANSWGDVKASENVEIMHRVLPVCIVNSDLVIRED
jgi:hypothetical protein